MTPVEPRAAETHQCKVATGLACYRFLQLLAASSLELSFDLPRTTQMIGHTCCNGVSSKSRAEHHKYRERSAPYQGQLLSLEPQHQASLEFFCQLWGRTSSEFAAAPGPGSHQTTGLSKNSLQGTIITTIITILPSIASITIISIIAIITITTIIPIRTQKRTTACAPFLLRCLSLLHIER